LATLSRKPNADEARDAIALVTANDDAGRGLAGLLWVLVNRSDFLLVQ
jgi:hypothetical protein